ncbi:MAG: hypothetical protein AAGB11_13580 [Pseudomonadota bacterium]
MIGRKRNSQSSPGRSGAAGIGQASVPSSGLVGADTHLRGAEQKKTTSSRAKNVGLAAQARAFRPSIVNAKLIYAGYLVSLAPPFVVLAIIAAIFAHQSAKQNPPPWLATHYEYQVRTFWIGFVANVIALALAFVGIGLLLLPLVAIWVVARAVNGLIRIAQHEPVDDPKSFFV